MKRIFSKTITGTIMTILFAFSAAFAADPGPLSPDEGAALKKRSEIDDKYKWDLTPLYKSEADWDKDFEQLKKEYKKLGEYEGKLGNSAETLLNCMETLDEIGMQLEKLRMYASLSKDINLKEQEKVARYEKIMGLYSDVGALTSFIRPEILSIPEDKIKKFLSENKKLAVYEHSIDDLYRMKPHTLSKSEEEILALASPVDQNFMGTYRMFVNADVKFPTIKDDSGNEIQLSQGRYYQAMYSTDRDYRERAYKAIYIPFLDYKNMLASLYVGSIKSKIFRAKARNYNSTLEAALDRNNIPVAVYKNLVESVNNNLEPLHRWATLKKRVLKIDELHPYDPYVTLFPAVKKEYTYDRAVEMTLEALKPLGEDYIKQLKIAFANRRVDVYETDGKRSGAYSTGAVKGVSPYVLLNWSGQLNDVFTLVHEMGHNLHSHYSALHQPTVYADYPIFLAEVASTTNEALLMDYLIKNAESKEEKLALIETYLNNMKGTFYRQTRFAQFEMEVQANMEKGEVYTADKLAEHFGKLYQHYWGDDMAVDEEEKYSWSRVHHFFYDFYVYQYATSFSASQAIAQKILTEGEPAVKKYLDFLKSGKSEYAIETLKKTGVDITTPAPFEAVARKADELLDQMEALLDEK